MKEIKQNIVKINQGIILHGCNCSGAFGSGVAGAIRRKWPEVYTHFLNNGTGDHLLGTIDICTPTNDSKITVANGYTQLRYGSDGQRYADLDAIRSCLNHAINLAIKSSKDLYLPKIGCGLGGLDWKTEVKPLILNAAAFFEKVNIFVCDL